MRNSTTPMFARTSARVFAVIPVTAAATSTAKAG
jgi:hypothetical protein